MASRASAPSLFTKPAGRPAICKAGEFPRTSFVYKFWYANIAYHVTWNFQILISFHLKKIENKDKNKEIKIQCIHLKINNSMFYGDVLMSFSSKNKKFLISSDGTIQDVCPYVRKVPIEKSFSMMKNYWLNHTLMLNK